VLSPPTLDYYLLDQMVAKMTLGIIDGNATAIGDALGTAVARIRKSDARSKAIILLTDGDSNAGDRSRRTTPRTWQRRWAARSTRSRSAPAKRSTWRRGPTSSARSSTGRGRFPVNPALLHQIAKDTGGEAYIATDGKALAESMHKVLDSLEKDEF